ncbi:MAG: tetratricopeptide repeat protein [Elusimicrobia bacterium]|nr:tetratricopeptide repeat protein [Elusimicrobiota bacterium]
MKHILIALLLAWTGAAAAQTAGSAKDIREQTPAELQRTAAELEQALILKPAEVDLYVKLGFAYTRLGRADDAQRAFESAARLDPQRAIAHYMLGLIYEKKGLKDKAIASWKSCLQAARDQQLKDTALKHLNNLSAN